MSTYGLPSAGNAGFLEPVIATLTQFANSVGTIPILDEVGRFWLVESDISPEGMLTLTVKNPNKEFNDVELVIADNPGMKDTDCLVKGFSTKPLSACRGTPTREPEPSDPLSASKMSIILTSILAINEARPVHKALNMACHGLAEMLLGDLPADYRYVVEYTDDRYLILTGAAEDNDLSFELFIRTEMDHVEEREATTMFQRSMSDYE